MWVWFCVPCELKKSENYVSRYLFTFAFEVFRFRFSKIESNYYIKIRTEGGNVRFIVYENIGIAFLTNKYTFSDKIKKWNTVWRVWRYADKYETNKYTTLRHISREVGVSATDSGAMRRRGEILRIAVMSTNVNTNIMLALAVSIVLRTHGRTKINGK